MDCSSAKTALLDYFWPARPPAAPLAPAVLAHLAACVACRQELAALGQTFTGGASPLTDSIDPLSCAECQELLPAYVEDESAGVDAARFHPEMARHLAGCADCRAQRDLLRDLVRADFAGALGPAPRYATFGERYRQRHPEPGLWEHTAEHFYRLTAELSLRVKDAVASFWPPPAQLAVQLVPVRDATETGVGALPTVEVVELPHPETNTVLKVSTGPVRASRTTLVLALAELLPPRPIVHARIALCDETGALLEGTATGDDGLAIFRDLARGRYTIQAEHAGQTWRLSLSLG
jgi:hypothetical protein